MGALESSEFLRQSRTVADSWGKAGAQTRYEAIPGAKVKKGETVVFAWIVFKSRAHRNRVNAKVMKDPEVDKEGDKFFGDGWKPIAAERVEALIHEQTSISKEAKDFITKLRQKYNLPVGETKS